MTLPDHIQAYLAQEVETQVSVGPEFPRPGSVAHGGITLYADIGGAIILRPSGDFVCVDLAGGRIGEEVDEGWRTIALVAGALDHPVLRELLPKKPREANDCDQCDGTGRITLGLQERCALAFCGQCKGLGWTDSTR